MSPSKVVKLHESIQNKLDKFRNTSKLYSSEQDKNYMALLVIEQTLRAKLSEGLITDIGKGISTVTGAIKSHVPGANVQSPVQHGSAVGHVKNAAGKFGQQVSSLAQASKYGFDKVGDKSSIKDFEKDQAAKKVNLSKEDRKRIQQSIINKEKLSPEDEQKYKLYQKEINMKKLDPSILEAKYRRLTESSMADAEVILAAKDLVDRIQDMVETLGKMVNSELPAIGESIRDVMTSEQSEAYVSSATSIINSALENIRNTKDELDKSTQVLAGEEAAPDLEMDANMDMDMDDMDIEEPILPKAKKTTTPSIRRKR